MKNWQERKREMTDESSLNLAAMRALVEGDMDNFVVAATPGEIEQQEAAGQQDFVANETLPIRINYGTKEQFERMGVVFGQPVDDLFCEAHLPDGWQKISTDHSMWSKLVDEQGRERASIFYKAAFYDRSAHLNIVRRFSYTVMPVGGYDDANYDYKTTPRKAIVLDCGGAIWESASMEIDEGASPYQVSDTLEPLAREWIEQNYPDWEDPLAYW